MSHEKIPLSSAIPSHCTGQVIVVSCVLWTIIYYHILSYIIIYYHILSYIIIYYHILSYIIIYYHILSYIIIYYHILSYIIIYYHILSYIVIYHHISSYIIIYYHILSYIIAYIIIIPSKPGSIIINSLSSSNYRYICLKPGRKTIPQHLHWTIIFPINPHQFPSSIGDFLGAPCTRLEVRGWHVAWRKPTGGGWDPLGSWLVCGGKRWKNLENLMKMDDLRDFSGGPPMKIQKPP